MRHLLDIANFMKKIWLGRESESSLEVNVTCALPYLTLKLDVILISNEHVDIYLFVSSLFNCMYHLNRR